MITEKLGKIAITPKGQYVAGTYERLDLVTDNGSSYISLKENNVSALTVKTDWMVVAEKGKAFEFSDFTPEQIALLQKPASDIATTVSNAEGLRVTAETNRNNAEGLRLSAEIIRNENEADRIEAEGLRAGAETGRQTAEGLRVQAEQDRQTNTSTAISNAEQATDDANDAAILANEKAGLANNAATLANTKAGLADAAATNANTKAGLADAAATNANNVANGYAADLAAKELKANKQNNLAPDGTGTKFPTVDAVNAGLVGTKSNLIYKYIVSGQKEIAISSIDYATNTFTSVAHGLANNTQYLNYKVINNGAIEKVIPFTSRGNLDWSGFYAVNVTPDTFQISLTSGGAAIPLINKATQDFSKWRFEVVPLANYLIPNIPADGCVVEILGDIALFPKVIFMTGYNQPVPNGYASSSTAIGGLFQVAGNMLKARYELTLRKTEYSISFDTKLDGVQLNTTDSTKVAMATGTRYNVYTENVTTITSLFMYITQFHNGTIINVYRK